jgi:hypothetical protein
MDITPEMKALRGEIRKAICEVIFAMVKKSFIDEHAEFTPEIEAKVKSDVEEFTEGEIFLLPFASGALKLRNQLIYPYLFL